MFKDYRAHCHGAFNPIFKIRLFSMGRGRGGSGFGRRMKFRATRRFAAAGPQLVILALLDEQPLHGYRIIKALEERSGGFYAPTPDTVYPVLEYLEEIGYATVETEGPRKLYRITQSGNTFLEDHRFCSGVTDMSYIRPSLFGAAFGFSIMVLGCGLVLHLIRGWFPAGV
jgi:DNA-binding PadR family transcriptional regulator